MAVYFSELKDYETYADVIARYRSCPAVSHICAFIVFPSTWMLLVANSTPMVLLLSRLNSFRVNRDKRLLFPTPESPIRTTEKKIKHLMSDEWGRHVQNYHHVLKQKGASDFLKGMGVGEGEEPTFLTCYQLIKPIYSF